MIYYQYPNTGYNLSIEGALYMYVAGSTVSVVTAKPYNLIFEC